MTIYSKLLNLPEPIDILYKQGRVKDITVISDLEKTYRGNPSEVKQWIDLETEITRSSFNSLKEYLDIQKKIETDHGKESHKEIPLEYEEENIGQLGKKKYKKYSVRVFYKNSYARLILNRTPSENYAWIRLEDNNEELEVELNKLTIAAIVVE